MMVTSLVARTRVRAHDEIRGSSGLKMVRLAEHIQWVEKHNALQEVAAFLWGLREDEWHHLGE
jgi:hypothetical protein